METVCKKCKQDNTYVDNPVVFCCQCRTPYHRFCHSPPIDRICIEVLDVPFYCESCAGQNTERSLETGVPGSEFNLETRKAYLNSLTKDQLVHLLQFAETIQPTLPIYPYKTRQYVAALEQENDDLKKIKYQMGPGNEDLIVDIITTYSNKHPEGTGISMQEIWQEMENGKHVNELSAAFKHATSRALQRALRRGRILEKKERYSLNPDYQPASDLFLTQLIKADDAVMFAHIPSRIPAQERVDLEKSDVFSHKVYA